MLGSPLMTLYTLVLPSKGLHWLLRPPLLPTRVSLTDGGRILAAAVWLEAAHSSSHSLHRQLRNGMNGAVLWENKLGSIMEPG